MSNQALPRDAALCADCGQVLEEDMPHICKGSPKKLALESTLGPGDHPTIPGEISESGVMDPAHELLGKIIGERYEIQCVLGQGGMGVVYQARHISLEKLLAVKLLLIAQNEEYQRRFLQEAQLASQINHPNTVFLSDFGVLPDGRSYIVMELLRGPTLASVIAEGAMDPMRACKIAAQIAHGLQAVHDQGIIHRETYEKTMTYFRVSTENAQRRRSRPVFSQCPQQHDPLAPVMTSSRQIDAGLLKQT